MSWLKKTLKVLEPYKAKQEAARLAEETRQRNIRKKEELYRGRVNFLQYKWSRLRIDRILRDIRDELWSSAKISEPALSGGYSGEPLSLKKNVSHTYQSGHRYNGHPDNWGPTYSTTTYFVIELCEDQIVVDGEVFPLNEVPNARKLQEKIDQYLAKRFQESQ